MIWIIFYVLPLILTYAIPIWMAVNRSEEGTTIGDLIEEFVETIDESMPFLVFVLITLIPVINILPFIASMFVCLYIKVKDIRVK